jgi:hypothetical protein
MRIETLTYNINWSRFRKGYSFFIPCIDCEQAIKIVKRITRKQRIDILTKVVIEEGIRGIRIWRV